MRDDLPSFVGSLRQGANCFLSLALRQLVRVDIDGLRRAPRTQAYFVAFS